MMNAVDEVVQVDMKAALVDVSVQIPPEVAAFSSRTNISQRAYCSLLQGGSL